MSAARLPQELASASQESAAPVTRKSQSSLVVFSSPARGGTGVRIIDDLPQPLFEEPGFPVSQMPLCVRFGSLSGGNKLDDRLMARVGQADRHARIIRAMQFHKASGGEQG